MSITTDAGLLRLINIASPAFPTGGFAYSQGLEWAHETGWIRDASSLQVWLDDLLTFGGARSEVIVLRHAYRCCADQDELASLAELAAAICLGAERHAETLAQGAAFAAACAAWGNFASAPYPVVFGAYCGLAGVAEDDACLAFLAGWASNMISASIRLGALGQSGGLRVLAALEPLIVETVHATRTAGLDDLGGVCFVSDIAAMRHETQYARLFRS